MPSGSPYSDMAGLDLRAISASLFLPLLLWTGSVVAISLSGYPVVICMTPLAWLLAMPVGLRLRREITPAMDVPTAAGPAFVSARSLARHAALCGAALGLWQGLLFAASLAFYPALRSDPLLARMLPFPAHPYLLAALVLLVGMPLTALLALLVAREK